MIFLLFVQNCRVLSASGYEHQLYDFKERGVDHEVEGVRYIEMHHDVDSSLTLLGP